MHSLKNSHTLANLEELLDLTAPHLDRDRYFVLRSQLDDSCARVNLLDDSLAALELSTVYLASVTNLHPQLTIIPDCLKDSGIWQ